AIQRALGHQCRLDARARRGIRVLVDRRIDAACARIVDQPERLYALSPVAGSYDLVMRDLRRQPALLADPDRLPDAVEDARRLIAHVRDVDSTHRASDAGQLDDFLDRRERTGRVEQAGAQTERTVLHRLAHELAHLLEL